MNNFMPKVKILNAYSNKPSIVYKKHGLSVFFTSIKYSFISLILIIFTVLIYNLNLIYQEHEIFKSKMLTINNTHNFEESSLLDGFSYIMIKEGKIDKNLADKYSKWIFEAASDNNIDPFLVLAVMGVESTFNFQAQSSAKAIGLMQVIYEYHKEKVSDKALLFDPQINIKVGSKVLKEYLIRSNYNETEALLRYNGSLGLSIVYSTKVLLKKSEFYLKVLNYLIYNK